MLLMQLAKFSGTKAVTFSLFRHLSITCFSPTSTKLFVLVISLQLNPDDEKYSSSKNIVTWALFIYHYATVIMVLSALLRSLQISHFYDGPFHRGIIVQLLSTIGFGVSNLESEAIHERFCWAWAKGSKPFQFHERERRSFEIRGERCTKIFARIKYVDEAHLLSFPPSVLQKFYWNYVMWAELVDCMGTWGGEQCITGGRSGEGTKWDSWGMRLNLLFARTMSVGCESLREFFQKSECAPGVLARYALLSLTSPDRLILWIASKKWTIVVRQWMLHLSRSLVQIWDDRFFFRPDQCNIESNHLRNIQVFRLIKLAVIRSDISKLPMGHYLRPRILQL